jgi:hypothetical protein
MEFNWLIAGTLVLRNTGAVDAEDMDGARDGRIHFELAKKFKRTPTKVIATSIRNFLEEPLKGCDLPDFADFERAESRTESILLKFPDSKIRRQQVQIKQNIQIKQRI